MNLEDLNRALPDSAIIFLPPVSTQKPLRQTPFAQPMLTTSSHQSLPIESQVFRHRVRRFLGLHPRNDAKDVRFNNALFPLRMPHLSAFSAFRMIFWNPSFISLDNKTAMVRQPSIQTPVIPNSHFLKVPISLNFSRFCQELLYI